MMRNKRVARHRDEHQHSAAREPHFHDREQPRELGQHHRYERVRFESLRS